VSLSSIRPASDRQRRSLRGRRGTATRRPLLHLRRHPIKPKSLNAEVNSRSGWYSARRWG